jgi:DNA-binding CsgD family transcriptional regulator
MRTLVGRSDEVVRVSKLVDDARHGQSGALVLRGEPGIGKTALLEHARAQAADMRVLLAAGVEAELDLPYSTLYELLAPVLDQLDSLPEHPRAALKGALSLGPPVEASRFAAAVGALLLLSETTDHDGPLLCVIDDAHWSDAASSELLISVARRLSAEGVAMVFAARTGEHRSFEAPGLPSLDLEPLSPEASFELIRGSEPNLDSTVAEALAFASRGNPLALRELPRALSEDERAGRQPLPDPLQVGDAILDAFAARLRNLEPVVRQALLVAAASHDGALTSILPVLDAWGIPFEALGAAEDAGLAELSGARILFRHPLIRSAVYSGAAPSERRRAHRALATIVEDPEVRARHLGMGAMPPDDAAAKELAVAAGAANRRGAPAEAAQAYRRASQLRSNRDERTGDLLASANAWWNAGRPDRAQQAIEELPADGLDPQASLELHHLQGRIAMWTSRPQEGIAILIRTAADASLHDPALASAMYVEAAMASFMSARLELALEVAHRAHALPAGRDRASVVMTEGVLAHALTLTGSGHEAKPLLLEVAKAVDVAGQLPGLIAPQTAWDLLVHEQYEIAERLLERSIADARESGAVAFLPYALAVEAERNYRIGFLDRAYANALESLDRAAAFGLHSEVTFSTVTLARIEAVSGHADAARHHAEEALLSASQLGIASVEAFATWTLGLLDLGLGQPHAAVTALERADDSIRSHGLREPSVIQSDPDLVEVYVRLGRREQAEQVLARYEEQAATTAAPNWLEAAAARCRGLLAADDEFDGHFQRALTWHANIPCPLDQARTELCWGERLRRAGRRIDARQHLKAALAAFEASGARPWAARARSELAATGAHARPRKPTPGEQLTPQEYQIAALVAEGATNKEAAAGLFLSTKTIEFHLRNVYLKLGVRSRTELASRFTRQG